jgi:hypothetical protein
VQAHTPYKLTSPQDVNGLSGLTVLPSHDVGQTLAIARSPFRQCQRSEAGPSGIRFLWRRPFPGGYFVQCVRMSPRKHGSESGPSFCCLQLSSALSRCRTGLKVGHGTAAEEVEQLGPHRTGLLESHAGGRNSTSVESQSVHDPTSFCSGTCSGKSGTGTTISPIHCRNTISGRL